MSNYSIFTLLLMSSETSFFHLIQSKYALPPKIPDGYLLCVVRMRGPRITCGKLCTLSSFIFKEEQEKILYSWTCMKGLEYIHCYDKTAMLILLAFFISESNSLLRLGKIRYSSNWDGRVTIIWNEV